MKPLSAFGRPALLVRRALGIYVRAAPWAAAVSIVVMVVGGLAPVAVAWFTRAIIEGLSSGGPDQVVVGVIGFVTQAIV